MEDRTLLATLLWANTSGGDWDTAANWVNQADPSDHHVPTAADDALIDTAGITITLTTGNSVSVNSLTISSPQTTLNLSNGTLSIAGPSTISGNLLMSGGTLTGAGTLTVSGLTTWGGGTMSGGGTTDALGGLALGGTAAYSYYSMFLDQRTFNNRGAAVFQGSVSGYQSRLFLSSGATFDNQAGAGFDLQGDNLGVFGYGGTPDGGTFDNEGALTKSAGSGTSSIGYAYSGSQGVAFNQSGSGSVAAQAGTLELLGGGSFSGTVEAVDGGSLTMTTTPTNLSSGTLTGATWLVGANSSMSLGADITTDAATIILSGSGASFSSLSGLAKIAAGGSLQLQGGASLATMADLGNAGTISLSAGTLNVTGNYTQEATGALGVGVGGLTPGSQFGQLNVGGQAALDGALNVSLLNGDAPPSGDSYRVLTFGSRAGDFALETGLYLGGGQGLSPTYDSSGLNLAVTPEQAGTRTAVASSLDPSTYGQPATFTVTVTPTVSTGLTPTGTVAIYDGGSLLGAVALDGGTATLSTSALVAGSHPIVAQYEGDGNFSGSNSTALTQTVFQDGSVTVVASAPNPSTYGQSVTFTATVTAAAPGAGTPTGTVAFYDGSTSLGSATLSGGSASLTTSALVAGSHPITAHYQGDTNFSGGTSTAVTQVVNQDGSVTNLSGSSVNPSVFGQAVTFTATVTAVSPGSGTPTGVVAFYAGSALLGTSGLGAGSASLTTSALPPGTVLVTATYEGDSNFTPSNSAPHNQTVGQDGSATAVNAVPSPSVFGQAVTFTATVSAAPPGGGTPTGTITFYDGSTALDTETLAGGSASFTTSALALGTHPITAIYGGDTDFTESTSPVVNQVVSRFDSTTEVSSAVEPSVFGQSVTLTATVSAAPPATGTPTGQVTFYDGGTALDTETLVNGTASYTTSALDVGGHSITAQYSGNAEFVGSPSTAVTQTVNQDGSTTAVASSLNPSNVGGFVTFTATVTADAPGSGVPAGHVTFYDGTTAIDTKTLVGDTASFTTSALSAGGHSITVQYGGSTDFAASTSTAITQTVNSLPPATLDGEVYADASGNGTIDAGAGLAGWTVSLVKGFTTVASTTIAAEGTFTFTGVVPGSYTIAVAEQAGYVPTVPSSGTLSISASSGQTITGLNLGEFRTVTIGGEVFNDVSDSGTFNPSDPGLEGWTVNLLSGSQVAQTVTTASDGTYVFNAVGPGAYTIAEVLQSGYIQTVPASGALSLSTSSGIIVSGENIGVTQIVPTLTLTLDRGAVAEAAGANTATATVTRNTGLDTDLVVTLASDETAAATAPATVTIPAGQASATFPIAAVDDGLINGPQTPTITASASGFVSGTARLTVDESDVPTLQVVLDTSTVEESGSVTGHVTRNWITAAPLAVTFSASADGRMTLPVVVIAANQASVDFTVEAIHDSAPEKDETFTLTAAAGGFVNGSADLTITDHRDLPTLTITPGTSQVVENGAGVTFTVSRAVAVDTSLTVKLSTSDANLAVPATGTVVIPAFATSTTFSQPGGEPRGRGDPNGHDHG
jgi:hypothetical protein